MFLLLYACLSKECSKSLGISTYQRVNISWMVSCRTIQKSRWFFAWRKIHSWFDEGLAVLVNHESCYDERAWKIIEKENISYPLIDELITTHQYQKNLNFDKIIVVTSAIAGHIVNQWYKKFWSEKCLYSLQLLFIYYNS